MVMLPLSLVAADTNAAILHTKGGVWVNGAEAVDSASIFPGDMVETKPGFFASLDAEGSSVLIQPASILKFQGNFLDLEHGSVSMGTSSSMGVHVNCFQIEPLGAERNQYDVKDTTGTVELSATKGDVKITQLGGLKKAAKSSGGSGSGVVHEGEQVTRLEADCGGASRAPTAGNAFPTKWVAIGGGVAGAVAICLVFCKSPSPNEISPADP